MSSQRQRREWQAQRSFTEWKTHALLYHLVQDNIRVEAILEFMDMEKPDATRLVNFIEGVAGDFAYQVVEVAKVISEEDLDSIDWNFIRVALTDIWLAEGGENE